MRYLNIFKINEEVSKNDPILEINQKEKTGIILLGIPGSGKSTFIKNEILRKNDNFKSFSTDYVSLKFTGGSEDYYQGSAEINIKYLKNYIETGQNFIYDTTGESEPFVREINKLANKNNYKLIFIVMLVDKETAKKRNILRGKTGGHQVDESYLELVYANQLLRTKNYLKDLDYDNFYIILSRDNKYKYFKHTGKSILRHKVDRYVPVVKKNKNQEYK